MAHYQYQGLHFELPDGISNEEALTKIKKHLNINTTPGAIPGQEGEQARVAALQAAETAKPATQSMADSLLGAGEAALSFGTGLVSGVQAPIAAGLKRAAGMVPDWEQETARLTQEQTYAPRTEKGQEYTKDIGEIMNRYVMPIGPGNLTGLAQSRPLPRGKKAPMVPETPGGIRAAVDATVAAPDALPEAIYKKSKGESARDAATIARLEAAISKQNPEKPTMAVTPDGQAYVPDAGAEAGRAVAERLNTEITQLKQMVEKDNRTIQQGLQPLLDARKRAQAQAMIEERQRALEQEVAKQTSLDMNAAERARQQNAPTGHATWVEQQRTAAERRMPGDNTPMDLTNPYPVDINEFPQVLKDAPLQQDGIPYDQPMLDKSLPIEVRDALGDTTSPDPFNRYSPQQAANRILREGEHPPIVKTQPAGRGATIGSRSQKGAIDPQVFEDLYKFGQSAVRGVDGMLMPVYHGTTKLIKDSFKTIKGFTEYRNDKGGIDANGWINAPKRAYPGDLGTWFSSTPQGTDTFAGARTGVPGGNVHQVYLNLKSPKVFNTHGDFIDWFHATTEKGQSANFARRQLVKQGYDGIQIKDSLTDAGGARQDFVAFHPEQIESAISPKKPPTSLRSQRGGIDPDLLTLGIPKAAKYLKDKYGENVSARLENIASKFGKADTGPDAFLKKLPGISKAADQYITKPPSSESVLVAAKAQGDGPNLATNWQSGLSMAAQKSDSVVLKNTSQWFNWSTNRANYLTREAIVPLETQLANLGNKLSDLHYVMQKEMFARSKFTPEQLASFGMNEKSVKAYESLRKTFDMFFDEQNKARKLLGKSEITRQEAYMASVFTGDYHLPINDKNGKLRFYIQVPTRNQAKAAIAWLKKEFAGHPEFNFNDLKYNQETMYRAGKSFGDVPRDVMSAWKDIVEAMGDDPLAAEIKQAMERWVDQKGSHAFRQDLHHVKEKVNVRGFEGDQPWLSVEDNAHNWAKAQISYLKQAAKWSAAQEAINNVKTLLTDPDVLKNQPNNVTLARAYMYNHMGLTQNFAKHIEASLAGTVGLSRESIKTLADVARAGVYIKTLTLSPGYIVATPLQAMHGSLAWFVKEAKAGNVKADIPKFLRSLFDGVTDEKIVKASEFNQQALKWADDNGVIKNIIYEEDRSIGAHPVVDKLNKLSDLSIGIPDRFARRAVFLPFANALWESGKYPTKEAAWMRAGEITDAIAVSMRTQDRPLIVQKMGLTGTMGYVFHAPIMNMYNHLSIFGRDAKAGNYAPLVTYLGAMAAVGGIWNLPGFNELEKLWEGIKSVTAEHLPGKYEKIKDFNPRETVLTAMPDIKLMDHSLGEVASYGLGSALTGADMRGRFSNEIINPEDTLGSMMPAASVYGGMAKSALGAAVNPNAFTGAQFAKDMAPGGLARGLIETGNDRFKSPMQPHAAEGITSYRNPNDLTEPGIHVNRNKEDVGFRRMGLTSMNESVRREKDYISDRETMRLKTARKGVFDSFFKSLVNDTGTEKERADVFRKYLALEGNPEDIGRQLERKYADLPFTKAEKQILKAKRYEQIMAVARRMEMEN